MDDATTDDPREDEHPRGLSQEFGIGEPVEMRRSRKRDGSTQDMDAGLDPESGALVIYEVDEGPIAAPMGGRYDKVTVVLAEHLPALLEALGAPTGADPLAFVIAVYKGTKKSWDLVPHIEASGVPYEQDWW